MNAAESPTAWLLLQMPRSCGVGAGSHHGLDDKARGETEAAARHLRVCWPEPPNEASARASRAPSPLVEYLQPSKRGPPVVAHRAARQPEIAVSCSTFNTVTTCN